MTPSQQVILWGVAVCVPVALAMRNHRLSALGIATMVLLGWALSRVMSLFYDPPESMAWYPVLDLMFGALVYVSWRQEHAWWKLTLIGLYLVQLAAHAAFWLAYPADGTEYEKAVTVYRYTGVTNVPFALELLTLAWAGGLDGLARRLGSWVFGGPSPPRHVGPAE